VYHVVDEVIHHLIWYQKVIFFSRWDPGVSRGIRRPSQGGADPVYLRPVTERTSRKIPVTERQFLWVQDDDKGEVTLHVGPTMVSPTAADRVVIDDGEG